MTEPAVGFLLERLLSPPPRVRWEVARSLAKLIRAGDAAVGAALLQWIGKRRLESEVALGLGVIQAFDLGEHLNAGAVEAAVNAPSFLSDWLMRSAFPDHVLSARAALPFAPEAEAVLPSGQAAWFDRYLTWAIAPILSHEFERLESFNGLPLMARWKHEWRWLQAQYPAPAAEYPWSYSEGARERRGQFDLGQREIYASAFLRTLAFAVAKWRMPVSIAEGYSRLVLAFNRGLADLEPIARPSWTSGLAEQAPEGLADTARSALAAAKSLAATDERLIALRVADITDDASLELNLRLVLGAGPISLRPDDVAELNNLSPLRRPGEVAGPLAEGADGHQYDFDEPVVLVQQLWPTEIGRTHTEIIPTIQVASPYILGREVEVVGGPADIRLLARDGVLSRWRHWYAEWDTTQPVTIDSCVCSVTTVRAQALSDLIRTRGLSSAWLVTGTFGTRPETYQEFKIESRSLWLPDI